MPEIVIRQLWILPRLADVNGNPATICQEFSPTMITVDPALVFVSRNGCTDRKASRNADAARQCNEIGVKIRTVTRLCVTCVHSITAAPASTGFVVAHATHTVIVKRVGAFKIIGFSRRLFLSERSEGFVDRYQIFRAMVRG